MKALLGSLALAAAMASMNAQRSELAEPTSGEVRSTNRAVVLAFHEALGAGDYERAEKMLAPGYTHYVVTSDGFKPLTWDAFKRGHSAALSAFPDWKNSPVRVVADGSFVSLTMIGTGTHRGSLAGEAPTGRPVTLPIAITHELQDGKLVADWEIANTEPLMKRLANPKP